MLIKSQIIKTDPAATGGTPSSKPAPKTPIKQTPSKPLPKGPKLPDKHGPKKKKTDPSVLHKQIRDKQKEIEELRKQQRVMARSIITGLEFMTPLKLINDEDNKKESVKEVDTDTVKFVTLDELKQQNKEQNVVTALDRVAGIVEKTHPEIAIEIDRVSDAIEKEISRKTLEQLRQGPKNIDDLLDKLGTKEFKDLIKAMQDPVLWNEMSKILSGKKEASITKPQIALDILGFLWNSLHYIPKALDSSGLKEEVLEALKRNPEWEHRRLVREARHFEKKRAPQVHSCPNGKFRIGKGPCKYNTREDATTAFLKWVKNLSKEAHSNLNTIASELSTHPIIAKAIESITSQMEIEYGIEGALSGSAALNDMVSKYDGGDQIKNFLSKLGIHGSDIQAIYSAPEKERFGQLAIKIKRPEPIKALRTNPSFYKGEELDAKDKKLVLYFDAKLKDQPKTAATISPEDLLDIINKMTADPTKRYNMFQNVGQGELVDAQKIINNPIDLTKFAKNMTTPAMIALVSLVLNIAHPTLTMVNTWSKGKINVDNPELKKELKLKFNEVFK